MIPLLTNYKNLDLEFRKIFYNFNISQQQTRAFSSLMITSAQPGEGKTITSIIFALGLSRELPHKCLLVDANWMTPQIHQWFGLKRETSLQDFWKKPVDGICSCGFDNLDILPAPIGVEVDSTDEFVKSETLKEVFDKLTAKYKTVIFDTSSINQNVSAYGNELGTRNFDSLLLSDFADTCVLVIMARKTNKQDVKRAKFALERGHHNIMAILNNYENLFYT
ncbi:CpsD/CapB family tyrosine-protein kinase [bacterium]|nr:CpsD/CapB family tyrosine-protein kinase [bacterium]